MARVIDIHPGQDGIVRVVTIKTSTGKVAVLIPTAQ